VVAAKGLRDFAKANPLLVIKGGVLDGKALGSDEITKLADLESREVLLSKLAGAMKAAPQQAVSLFAAPLAQAARLFAALQDKLPAEAAPVADEAPAAEAVQDTVDAPAEASTEETASADS
jgi:large subunit ribosomal protein L10